MTRLIHLLLIMGDQIRLGLSIIFLPNLIKLRFIKDEIPFIGGGIFIHLCHPQGVHRTGLHTETAKDALGHINIKRGGNPPHLFSILHLAADHLNTMGGAGDLAEIATDASLLSIFIPKKAERPSVCVWEREFFVRILQGHLTDKDMLKRQL